MRKRHAAYKPYMTLQDWAWSMVRNHEDRIAYYQKILSTATGRRRGGFVSQLNQAKKGLAYWQKELERIEKNYTMVAK